MYDVRRTLKFQRDADPRWAEEVAARPGCEGLFSCQQCGTCSATCPLSLYMDLGPRRVIALVREGFRKDALTSQTVWLCASCYECDVACPRQIRLTDLMGSLKREAARCHLYPRRFPVPVVERELCEVISHGRWRPESWRILGAVLRFSPAELCRLLCRRGGLNPPRGFAGTRPSDRRCP
ncbi:MAG: 4Fe-4S dicluster domain-containing protein [Acidobacteriia bacterium]|nr:4Fe-4S dicluster domain-containing protein [Terriglobia bacterium]